MNSNVKTIPYGISDFVNICWRNGYKDIHKALDYYAEAGRFPLDRDSEKVAEIPTLLGEAKIELEHYAEDPNLAEKWCHKPQGTVTLIRLALVFHGEELLFAEEI